LSYSVKQNVDVLQKIDAASRIVLIVSKYCDADSFGSASAFYTQLMRLEKKVTLLCSNEKPNYRLTFLPWFNKMRYQFASNADLFISFGCMTSSEMGFDIRGFLINIDHRHTNTLYGDLNIIDINAISTTQVVYDLLVQYDFKLNEKMATALYAGLLVASRGFQTENVQEQTFKFAAVLCAANAQSMRCSAELFQRRTLAALRLKGSMFQMLQLFVQGQLAVLQADRNLLLQTGATLEECMAVFEEVTGLPTVKTTLMLYEKRTGEVSVFIRRENEVRVDGGADIVIYDKRFAEVLEMFKDQIQRELT